MDRYVKGFIVMSIVYLGVAALLGIIMLGNQNVMALKFVHSHLNMLGWVSMMIYGVGYHILPRFMGRPLYSNRIGEAQFYLANISLVGLLICYSVNVYSPGAVWRAICNADRISAAEAKRLARSSSIARKMTRSTSGDNSALAGRGAWNACGSEVRRVTEIGACPVSK